MKLGRGVVVCAVAMLMAPSWVQAQSTHSPADGFDASWRMRAFEAAFEENDSAEARNRATPALHGVMRAAFSPRPMNVSAEFDKARLAILYPDGPEAAAVWAASLSVRPGTRLLEAGAKTLPVTLAAFYDANVPVPDGVVLHLSLAGKNAEGGTATTEKIAKLPQEISFEIGDVRGDCTLRAQVEVAGKILHQMDQTVSLVSRPAERLAKLNDAVAALPKTTLSLIHI